MVLNSSASRDGSGLEGRPSKWSTFFVLDFALHVVNGVRTLHLQSDGLASQGFHKNLHATSEAKDKVEGGLLLDVVVSQSPPILQLLASKDQPLLVRWDACENYLVQNGIADDAAYLPADHAQWFWQ